MTLEYAILIPLALLLIFTCFQIALYAFARSVAQTAAEEAVNAQRAYGAPAGTARTTALATVARTGDALGHPKVTVQVTGGEVRVTVTGSCVSLLPFASPFTVTQTASGPVERFVP